MADSTFETVGHLTRQNKRCYGPGFYGLTLELRFREKAGDNHPDLELVAFQEGHPDSATILAVLWRKEGGKTFASGKPDGFGRVQFRGATSVFVKDSNPRFDPEDADYAVTVAYGATDDANGDSGNGRREVEPRQQRGAIDSDAKPAPARQGGKAFDDDDDDPFADGR